MGKSSIHIRDEIFTARDPFHTEAENLKARKSHVFHHELFRNTQNIRTKVEKTSGTIILIRKSMYIQYFSKDTFDGRKSQTNDTLSKYRSTIFH